MSSFGVSPKNFQDLTGKRFGRLTVIKRHTPKDYMAFHDWAFANGYDQNAPKGKCTIDRIDPNGDYEPSNCRWVDMKTQNANRRPFKHGNRYTKAKGESRAIHD